MGTEVAPERRASGVLDTCAWIDIDLLEPAVLPVEPELTAVTMAELHQGVASTQDPVARAARTERLALAIVSFAPLPFDGDAAAASDHSSPSRSPPVAARSPAGWTS